MDDDVKLTPNDAPGTVVNATLGFVSPAYHVEVRDRLTKENEALRGCLEDAVRDLVKRCWECDAPASWHEVGWNGQDKHWCEEHVCIPQRAISKGAGRYQPQRMQYAAWLVEAMRLLGVTEMPSEPKEVK